MDETQPETDNAFFRLVRSVDWTAVAGVLSVIGTIALAIAAAVDPAWTASVPEWQFAAVFGGTIALGVIGALWKAALESRFFLGTEKKRDHISGWSFLALASAMAAIVFLASWAASSSAVDRVIHAQWGIFVVVGVAGAFFIAALTPSEEFLQQVSDTLNPVTAPIRLLGRWLSGLDALVVFGVAGAAGALRAMRISAISCCLAPSCPAHTWGTFCAPHGASFRLVGASWLQSRCRALGHGSKMTATLRCSAENTPAIICGWGLRRIFATRRCSAS